ncbi:hypothetical protein BDV40DRAFT_262812 [Aspergillus tamarii]|uniref:Uncharacterized protein n=1 Tax=Aspergillus tamarii TaxID=41984 RepID=A0A5N6UXW0_ASPTM|nr:hypothetical protein BDV40DRAFT_262812 [Aspergillus tamarii]
MSDTHSPILIRRGCKATVSLFVSHMAINDSRWPPKLILLSSHLRRSHLSFSLFVLCLCFILTDPFFTQFQADCSFTIYSLFRSSLT